MEERGAGEGVSESGSDAMEEDTSGDDEFEKAVPPVQAAKGVKRTVRARKMERAPRAMLKNDMFWWHVFRHNRSVTSAVYHPRVAARKAHPFFFFFLLACTPNRPALPPPSHDIVDRTMVAEMIIVVSSP